MEQPEVMTNVTKTVQIFTDDVVKAIQTEISRSADDIYKSLSDKITADVCNQIRDHVAIQLRGETLFSENSNRVKYVPKEGNPIRDERKVVEWTNGDFITNYGRVIDNHYGQKLEPKAKLTDEVIEYLRQSNLTTCVKIIEKYNEKYAFAYNSVHDEKVKEVRAEIKQELSDEYAKLEDDWKKLADVKVKLKATHADNIVQAQLNEAQVELLKTEREEFEAAVAKDAEHRKSEQELETSKKQIELIKRQLASEIARNNKNKIAFNQQRKELKEYEERLKRLHKKLKVQADLLDLEFDSELTESSSED